MDLLEKSIIENRPFTKVSLRKTDKNDLPEKGRFQKISYKSKTIWLRGHFYKNKSYSNKKKS